LHKQSKTLASWYIAFTILTWQKSLVTTETTATLVTKPWPNNFAHAPSNPLCPLAPDRSLLIALVALTMAPNAVELCTILDMNVFNKYPIKNVVHVGANVGEELDRYVHHGVERVMFFEPRLSAFQMLSDKCDAYQKHFKQLIIHNIALGTSQGIVHMNIASNGQSSSILKPKLHLEVHPDISFSSTQEVRITRGDKIILPGTPISLLHVDVQGYELEVFKGFGKCLDHVWVIECECNIYELYEGCSRIAQVDNFLSEKGFTRTFTPDMSQCGWGDCIYERLP